MIFPFFYSGLLFMLNWAESGCFVLGSTVPWKSIAKCYLRVGTCVMFSDCLGLILTRILVKQLHKVMHITQVHIFFHDVVSIKETTVLCHHNWWIEATIILVDLFHWSCNLVLISCTMKLHRYIKGILLLFVKIFFLLCVNFCHLLKW